ncbi:Ribonuclease H-like superfamily [Arabidopsis thaliana x Arabidopsis arenosa]|nr:Ribonuclease H-like superfamily [Arabidopsis thaliana x Arabidopsis arenosa]KAG7635342.1 Ribonuclease H-like superfamily [Arabidopsis suecica]
MSTSTVETGYGGRIRVTVARNDRDITSEVRTFLCNKENANKIIGLDTERSVVGGDSEYPPESKLVILELSDGQNCLIIPLPYVQGNKLPVSLTNFLNLPDFTFTGVGINKALKMLKSECGLTCKNAVDIGPSSWASLS